MLRKVLINKVWLYLLYLLITSPTTALIGLNYLQTDWINLNSTVVLLVYLLAEFALLLSILKVYRFQCELLTKRFYLKDYLFKIFSYLKSKSIFILIAVVLIFINKYVANTALLILVFSALSNSLVNILDSGMVSPRDGQYVASLRYYLISTATALVVVLISFLIFKALQV